MVKLSVDFIMGFKKAAEKVEQFYDKQCKESKPNSPERQELGDLMSAVATVKRMADVLGQVEAKVTT